MNNKNKGSSAHLKTNLQKTQNINKNNIRLDSINNDNREVDELNGFGMTPFVGGRPNRKDSFNLANVNYSQDFIDHQKSPMKEK
jgi:hypothetical protein